MLVTFDASQETYLLSKTYLGFISLDSQQNSWEIVYATM